MILAMPSVPKKKPTKPHIPYIQREPPAIGSRVKVWFDKGAKEFLIESETGAVTQDIYGICLGDVVFDTETTARGAVRCFVIGTFLAVPGSHESREVERQIRAAAPSHLEFYWWRDKKWPISKARLARIAPPHGGFPTSLVVDPVKPDA